MKRLSHLIWPLIALLAMGFSFWLLSKELKGLSMDDVMAGLRAIPMRNIGYAALATLVAYFALAWYDRIGLMHLGHAFSWTFISIVSFTTYALSHNIGASMFTGGVVRYRAYSTKGLNIGEVAFLVAFCSFTFALGTILLGGLVLMFEPQIIQRLPGDLPLWTARVAGGAMLAFVALYFIGSTMNFKPLTLGKFKLVYPRINVTLRQMVAAPIELIGAAGIIYFAMPETGNPGFFIVLGVFLASFSAGLLSHAPGGIGVLEATFITAMPDAPKAEVIAALLVFRLFYLIVPLVFSLVVVAIFERAQIIRARDALHAPKGLAGLTQGLKQEAEKLEQDARALRENKNAAP